MWDFLSSWPPGMVIGLTAVVGGCLTAIVWGIAIFWSWARREEIAANLKRDLIQRGLSVEEIERLLRAPHWPSTNETPTNERELDANLASLLVQYEVSAPTMEQIVRTFQAADPASKKAVFEAIKEMLESDADQEQLVAAIRTLCTPRNRDSVLMMG